MEKEDVLSLFDTQRKLFNDVMDRLHKEMREDRNEFHKRMAEVISSLEFSQREIEQLKGKVNELQKERKKDASQISSLQQENEDLIANMKILNDRMDFLDDQGRSKNLRFSGIPEGQNENWEQSQQKVNRILNDCLNISPLIDRAHRVGKPSQNRPRDVIVKFSSSTQRDTILRDRTKLKGTQIYINEDLCPGTINAQKRQMESYYSARRDGKIAYFNRKTLIIKEKNVSSRETREKSNNPTPSTPTVVPRGHWESDTTVTPRTPPETSQEPPSTAQTPSSGVDGNIEVSLKRFRGQRSASQVEEVDTPTGEGAVGGETTVSGRGRYKKSTGNKSSRGGRGSKP